MNELPASHLPSVRVHAASPALFILCELLSLPHAWRKRCAGVNSEEEEIAEAIRLAEQDLKEHRS